MPLFAGLLISVCVLGCCGGGRPDKSSHVRGTTLYDDDDIKRMLRPGMTPEEVENSIDCVGGREPFFHIYSMDSSSDVYIAYFVPTLEVVGCEGNVQADRDLRPLMSAQTCL